MNFKHSYSINDITHLFADWVETTDWTEYELRRFPEANINGFAETVWESSHFWGGCQGGRDQIGYFLEMIATLELHYQQVVSRALHVIAMRAIGEV